MTTADFTTDFMTEQFGKVLDWAVSKAGSLLLAFVFLLVGIQVVKVIMMLVTKAFDKTKRMDPTVESFLASMIRVLLYALVFITTATMLGFEVTSFVTLLGTAGVTVGLALQGSLSNLAGGVLILILKPFSIGDYIREDTRGNEGTVTAIDIFYTRIRTVDGKMVVVPNGTLSNNSMINYTSRGLRRVELALPIPYEAKMNDVRDIVQEVLEANTYVIQDQPKMVRLDGFDDSSMRVMAYSWVKSENYLEARWAMLEEIKNAFDEKGINIPFPQMDVHIKEEGE